MDAYIRNERRMFLGVKFTKKPPENKRQDTGTQFNSSGKTIPVNELSLLSRTS
ncbi:hypothetical protein CHS0354_010350 [Potamilus streckersoni]|uniref:Uncharacterized protein n=1 Tax=Potamilus streckersoni TaxID=2493646 RepID=A0AAE0TEN0_9BIVA|nr:hypothetical protein CHS0354_010350 [Potamilus streckersoni]